MVMRKKRVCYTKNVKLKKSVKRKVTKKATPLSKLKSEIILNNTIRGQNSVYGYGKATSVKRTFRRQEDAKKYARNQAKRFGFTYYYNLLEGRKVRV